MRVLIATGGSGGHIFPAVETAKALRVRGHQVSFAGVLGPNQEKITILGFPVFSLAAKGLTDVSLKGWLNFSRTMSQAIFRSFGVVHKCAPDKIIGFGGYGAFPVAMAGALMGRPVMIHEQNVMPGRANIVLSKIVKKVAISFEAGRRYLPSSKVVWTGCPCHSGALPPRAQGLAAFGLEVSKKTVLLVGGSQGSRKLNEVFFGLMKELKEDIQAIHMTGPAEFSVYQERYLKEKLPVKVFAFINNIKDAYAAADVVVARAGAATVTELGLLGLPAVLVPYPFAGNHQKFNAEVLAKAGAAVVVEQKDLDQSSLEGALKRMLDARISREELLGKTRGLFQQDAALQLALVAEGL